MERNENSQKMPSTVENTALGFGFERTLPKWKKGQKVRVWIAGRFMTAEIVRRMPGPVYWAKVTTDPRRGESVIVSCANFGGVVDAD